MKIYDVVIVGAGPVGLATAIGLYSRGITNILVIDKTRVFQKVGQGIDLLPNGLKALKYIDCNAYEAVKAAGFKPTKLANSSEKPKWETRNTKGEKISQSSISLEYDDWYKIYGEGRNPINWYDLQTALRKQLPSDLVVANRRCTNIVQESDRVRIDCLCNGEVEANPYAYWDESKQVENEDSLELISKSFLAKLVVAADGINSRIRQVLYQNSSYCDFAKPEYSGFTAISCGGIELPEAIANELQETFLKHNGVVSISNEEEISENNNNRNKNISKLILFRRESKFGYLIHVPLPSQELKDRSGQELIDLTVQKLEEIDFPLSLRKLVAKSPPEAMVKRLYHIHRTNISDSLAFPETANLVNKKDREGIEPIWHQDRVVLVGDAAHGMPPFAAQGANQGLEDAAVISTLIADLAKHNDLDNTDAISAAFLKYERLRRPMMQIVQEATMKRYLFSSERELQDYSKQVYARNLEEIITALV